jgi:YegS/Rv2252/BmrU family lipid kinase
VKNEVNKVLFIINKFAGTGYQPELEGRIITTCEANDVECTIEFTRSRGHATELAKDAAATSAFQKVIAVGGDGTINEVAQGLLHTKTPMGIIPRGSGNGLARHLGIPLKVGDAVSSLFSSDVLGMDTFSMNGKLSLNVSGIGFDGHIANIFGGKTKRGLAGYAKIALQEFVRFKEFESEIQVNGQKLHRKAFIIAIANSSQYGNNARIAPAASVCDQLLHVNILRKVPAYRFDFVYSLFTGDVESTGFCEITEARSIDILLPHPIPYHVDGEPCGENHQFHIELSPAALQVLVPHKTNRKGNL